MPPPTDDEFYMRSETIPYYKMKEVAMKERGIPAEYVTMWSAQRQARAVITQQILDEARRYAESACF